jgi:hypothetical protein
MGSLLRFSHAGTHLGLALPALNPDFLYGALDATAYAAFVKESRKKRVGATKLRRKSGEARDESRDFSRSAKRSLPRINAGASNTNSANPGPCPIRAALIQSTRAVTAGCHLSTFLSDATVQARILWGVAHTNSFQCQPFYSSLFTSVRRSCSIGLFKADPQF